MAQSVESAKQTDHSPVATTARRAASVATPVCLGVGVLMLFLPWVKVQCTYHRTDLAGAMVGFLTGGFLGAALMSQGKPEVARLSQSGLQLYQGEYNYEVDFTPKATPDFITEFQKQTTPGESVSSSLPLWYGLALAVALGAWFMPLGRWRLAVVGACAAAALILLIIQVEAGIPLMEAVRPGAISFAVSSRYTLWILLAFGTTAAAMCLAGVDLLRGLTDVPPGRIEPQDAVTVPPASSPTVGRTTAAADRPRAERTLGLQRQLPCEPTAERGVRLAEDHR
jgi:hypothetical protein